MSSSIKHTSFEGVFLLESDIYGDHRGNFRELYHEKDFHALGIDTRFVQDNVSVSKKGALRGLHFQKNHPQSKLISPLSGAIFDVIVDIRKDSLTYGQAEGYIVETGKGLFLPKGFAHGFLALRDDTIVAYKCDDFYDASDECGIFWDDDSLGVDWKKIFQAYGIEAPIISEKDANLPRFSSITQ